MRWYQSSAGLHSLCCGRLYPCRRARLPYPVSGAPSGRGAPQPHAALPACGAARGMRPALLQASTPAAH